MNDDYQNLRIAKKQALTPDVVMFDLVHPEGAPLPVFTPGAHITVKTPKGLHRSYSLCGEPLDTQRWLIAVKRETTGRGGSLSMFDLLEGEVLPTKPWLNQFELNENAKSYLFVAGGIGITPILSMMRHLMSQGKSNFHLFYCTRDELNTPFMDLLSTPEWSAMVTIHHDHGDPSQSLDLWPIFESPNGADVYCCGPKGLMESVQDMTGHWPSECIHFESFGASDQQLALNTPFELVLNASGQQFHVPEHSSILDVLRAEGYSIKSSCESGTCGSCKTRFISGEVEHRDFVLLEEEKADHIMVCVSRAKSPTLVLDL